MKNLTKRLENCKDVKLYSTMVGECILKYIDDTQKYPMIVSYKKGGMISFTQHGSYFDNVGECILFPSKRCRDWSLFVKKGEILDIGCGIYYYIKETGNLIDGVAISIFDIVYKTVNNKIASNIYSSEGFTILNEEEKQKLFMDHNITISNDMIVIETKNTKKELLKLVKLLKYRDYYWEKDNFFNPKEDLNSKFYAITEINDSLEKQEYTLITCGGRIPLLSFRTESLRDKFLYEYKELIELCKEYL